MRTYNPISIVKAAAIRGHKGMNTLINLVVGVVAVGLVATLGVILNDKLAGVSGLSNTAVTAVNATRDAIATIPNTWIAIVVVMVVVIYLLGLFMGSFRGFGGGQQR